MHPDFPILAPDEISAHFLKKNIRTFSAACAYIRSLPYKRNADKNDRCAALRDGFGTCSTKHAVLYSLAQENNIPAVKLVIGIFRMNGHNTPAVKNTLQLHRLDHIPEAHTYLNIHGQRYDYTGPAFAPMHFVQELIEEREIEAHEITGLKVAYHQQVLKQWLIQQPELQLSFDALWKIREQCIADLSQ